MGHVDAGKTKLLDCIRKTNVQKGEAGGITQQIGTTYIPAENIRERTNEFKPDAKLDVPGLLVIDTPGHESFKNLRFRGSGLCDIAVLVVSIMKGLEPQTIESLNLLRMRNTDFIVALNKVDTIYGWKTYPNVPIRDAMKRQSKDVQAQFKYRLTQDQGLNTEIYNKNKDRGETYSIVPTGAISGEGIPEMLLLLVQWAQKTMVEKLAYCSEIQCTVLEVKVTEGLGTTIDVILVNGVLHEKDEINGNVCFIILKKNLQPLETIHQEVTKILTPVKTENEKSNGNVASSSPLQHEAGPANGTANTDMAMEDALPDADGHDKSNEERHGDGVIVLKCEFAPWAPHRNVVMYVGTAAARNVIKEYEFYFPKSHKKDKKKKSSHGTGESKHERIKFDVLLTSYEMINIDNGLLEGNALGDHDSG